jgi:hypothetical protein
LSRPSTPRWHAAVWDQVHCWRSNRGRYSKRIPPAPGPKPASGPSAAAKGSRSEEEPAEGWLGAQGLPEGGRIARHRGALRVQAETAIASTAQVSVDQQAYWAVAGNAVVLLQEEQATLGVVAGFRAAGALPLSSRLGQSCRTPRATRAALAMG